MYGVHVRCFKHFEKDVHVRRTCMMNVYYHTCTAYMYGVPVRRTCMIV